MARIRTIKPEIFQDEKLAPLDPIHRFVFIGLISMADDGGRMLDNVKIIDAYIFPETEDTCRQSLDVLADLGRIKRGMTASGQRVIQVVNWSHQRIDRPNFAGALPPIDGDTPQLPVGANTKSAERPSTNLRGKLSDRVVDAVWSAAKGDCQQCGTTCRRRKVNKYDAGHDLGEVDHILALRDGGDNSLENLQLLCLKCNRVKAGQAASARNRGTVVEESTKPRRTISVPTTNDQLPTTVDRSSDSTPVRGWSKFEDLLPAEYWDAVAGALRAASDPDALRRQLVAMHEAITGGTAYSPAVIGQAIHELAVAGSRVTAAGLRAFCRRIAEGEKPIATKSETPGQKILRLAAEQDAAA